MTRSFSRRLLSFCAVVSVVSTLAASACPTCEDGGHAVRLADSCCGADAFAGEWQEGAGACACCESDECSGGAELPGGRLQRAAPTAPAAVASAVPAAIPPSDFPGGAPSAQAAPPPGRTKLYLRHASLLC